MNIIAGGQYGLAFEDNNIVKEQRKFALKSLHEIGFGSAALEDSVYHYAQEIVTRWTKMGNEHVDVTENIIRAIGNVIWHVTFGINLEFDNPIILEFRRLQLALIPLLASPFMMFVELFPILRKIDFLIGSPTKRLMEVSSESHVMLKEAINTTQQSFNPDNEPSCYIEAFLAEQKNREEAGKPIGDAPRFHYKTTLHFSGNFHFEQMLNTLRMCFLQLVNNPEAQRQLQKEIDDVVGDRV
ncbi:hypothetical protein PENTCL1PPCAC_23683, partial [Pristionchus entomophagus]